MTQSGHFVIDPAAPPDASDSDMFAALPPLDALDVKMSEIAASLAALLAYSGRSRTEAATSLEWKKSRVTSVLSGRGNPTVKTLWQFCTGLGFDFDIVFRRPHESRPQQPWQKVAGVTHTTLTLPGITFHRPFFVRPLSAENVRDDVARGSVAPLYLRFDERHEVDEPFELDASADILTSRQNLTLISNGSSGQLIVLNLSKARESVL